MCVYDYMCDMYVCVWHTDISDSNNAFRQVADYYKKKNEAEDYRRILKRKKSDKENIAYKQHGKA